MIKTATVTGILGCKPWDGNNGRLYFHKLELSNGESGEIGKKTENAFKIGDSLTYTSEESPYGLKFKTAQTDYVVPAGSTNRTGYKSSTASFALSYAKDIAVANINKADAPLDMEALAGKVIATAEKFQIWLRENE